MKNTPKALHYVTLTESELDALTDCLILCGGLAAKEKEATEMIASRGGNYPLAFAMLLRHFMPDDKEFYELTKRLLEELSGHSI